MSWLLNFGGPGWIQDVFEVNIVVDNPLRGSTDCLYIGVEDAPLYACDHAVSGVVEITAPLGHEVWCEGIEVTLEVGAMMYEELNSVDMASVSKELLLNGGRYIKGKMRIPFSLDLAELPAVESFDGELFAIRHELAVTVRRPWYTFNVDNSIALCVQHVTEERAAPKPERTLEVSDCGGVCSLAYGSGTIRIGNALPISLKVCDQTIPLSTVVALFFRVEECEGDSYETVLFEVKLHDDSDSPILGEAQILSFRSIRCVDTMSEKVTSDASIAGKSANATVFLSM